MVGAYPTQLVVGRVRADAPEEDTCFGLPSLEVGPQDCGLLAVWQLRRPERLDALSDAEFTFAGNT